MAISRQALAAALLGRSCIKAWKGAALTRGTEYDNDNVPAYARRDHRQSAIFSLAQTTRRPQHQPSAQQQQRPWSPEYDNVSVPSPMSRGWEEVDRLDEGNEQEDDVDIDRWDLPEHLISEETKAEAKRAREQTDDSQKTVTRHLIHAREGQGDNVQGHNRQSVRSPMSLYGNQPSRQGERGDVQGLNHQSVRSPTSLYDNRQSLYDPTTDSAPLDMRTASRNSIRDLPTIQTRVFPQSVPTPQQSPFQSRARSVHLDSAEADALVSEAHRPYLNPSQPETRRRTISFDPNDVRRRTYSDHHVLDNAQSAIDRSRHIGSARAASVMGFAMVDSEYQNVLIREPIMVPLPASPSSTHRPVSGMSRRLSSSMGRRIDERDPGEEDEEEEDLGPNPFALPAPPVALASRFDPKARANPTPTLSGEEKEDDADAGTSTLRPAARSDLSLSRPVSMANLDKLNRINDGTSTPINPEADIIEALSQRPSFPDVPSAEKYGKPLLPSKYARRGPVDRHALLRPKTLIMPSGLAGTEKRQWAAKVPEGFVLGEKPLPAGARTSILSLGDGRAFGAALAAEQMEVERARLEVEERERRAAAESRKERMPGKLYVSDVEWREACERCVEVWMYVVVVGGNGRRRCCCG